MKNKYRIKQEILKNGESRYTIQKKVWFWWKSYFIENGYGSYIIKYENLQEALDRIKSFEEADKIKEGKRVVKVMYLYKEGNNE